MQRRELDAEQKRLKAEQSRLLYERSELQHLLVNCQHQVDVAAAQIAAAENSRFQANPATAEQVSEQVCEQPDKQAGKMAGEQAHEQELRIAAELSALTARSEELSTREGELNRRVAEISERESRLATDSGYVRQKEQNLAEREQQLEQRYLEYDARNRELEQLRAETTSAAEELAKDRAAENTTPASEQTTLAEPVRSASPTATETSIEKSTAKPAEEPSPQAEQPAGSNSGPMPQPTTDVAPKSAPDQDEDAIFARLRRLSLLKSDSGTKSDESNSEPLDPPDAIEELEESPPEPSVEQPPMENEKPLSSAHCDEDSVEAYMARLLTRLRNNGSSTPAPAPATNNTSFRRATEMVAERDQEAAVRQTIVEPLDKKVAEEEKKDAEWTLQPRSQAPELTSDLKAMRELANMNTQVALDKHVQKRWSSAAIGKAGVAGVAVASGIYLMITANSLEDMEFLSGATAMIVAIFWGLQSLILTKQVQDVRKKKPEARFDHHLGRSKMIPGETKSGDMVMDLDTADDSDDDETNQG